MNHGDIESIECPEDDEASNHRHRGRLGYANAVVVKSPNRPLDHLRWSQSMHPPIQRDWGAEHGQCGQSKTAQCQTASVFKFLKCFVRQSHPMEPALVVAE